MSGRPGRRWGLRSAGDRGVAAVEFALLLPLLLLIIFGLVDFGRALNAQITLTQAAREGARVAALGGATSQVQSRATLAADPLSPVTVTVLAPCLTNYGSEGYDAQVQTSYSFSFITPVGAFAAMFGGSGYGAPITLTAEGVMPCET